MPLKLLGEKPRVFHWTVMIPFLKSKIDTKWFFYYFSRHNETVWPSSHNKAYRCVYGWGVLHCNGAGRIWRGKKNFKSVSLLHHFMTLVILCVLIVFRWGHIFRRIDIQLTWKHFLVTFSNSARLCHIWRARISYTGRQ